MEKDTIKAPEANEKPLSPLQQQALQTYYICGDGFVTTNPKDCHTNLHPMSIDGLSKT